MAGCIGGCHAGDVKKRAGAVGARALGCFSGAMSGFTDFILRGNVVDLAVAIVVGTSFTALVNALVSDWLTPLIAIIFSPEEAFGSLKFTINGSVFNYGHFLNAMLSFLLVCLSLYFLVVLPLNALVQAVYGKKKTRECPECCSDIPAKARRCMYCCQPVEPLKRASQGLIKRLMTGEEDEVVSKSCHEGTAPSKPASVSLAVEAKSCQLQTHAPAAEATGLGPTQVALGPCETV